MVEEMATLAGVKVAEMALASMAAPEAAPEAGAAMLGVVRAVA